MYYYVLYSILMTSLSSIANIVIRGISLLVNRPIVKIVIREHIHVYGCAKFKLRAVLGVGDGFKMRAQ